MKVASLVGLLVALPATYAVENLQNVILGNALRAQVQEVDGKTRYLVENCVVEVSSSVSVVSQVSDSEGARRLEGVSTCIVEMTSAHSVYITAGDAASPLLKTDRAGKKGAKVPTAPKTKGPKTKAPKATKCPGKTKGPKTKGPKAPKGSKLQLRDLKGTKGKKTKGPKTKGPSCSTKGPKTKGPKTKGPKGPKGPKAIV